MISYNRVNHLDLICIIQLIYYSYVTFISPFHHIRSIKLITRLSISKIISPLVTCSAVWLIKVIKVNFKNPLISNILCMN